eukprot:106550-Rhodomonas_salina.1
MAQLPRLSLELGGLRVRNGEAETSTLAGVDPAGHFDLQSILVRHPRSKTHLLTVGLPRAELEVIVALLVFLPGRELNGASRSFGVEETIDPQRVPSVERERNGRDELDTDLVVIGTWEGHRLLDQLGGEGVAPDRQWFSLAWLRVEYVRQTERVLHHRGQRNDLRRCSSAGDVPSHGNANKR